VAEGRNKGNLVFSAKFQEKILESRGKKRECAPGGEAHSLFLFS
jgi:hypothetical protein